MGHSNNATELEIKTFQNNKILPNKFQSHIIKREVEIKDLKSEGSIRKQKKYVKLRFLDEKMKEEYSIDLYLNYNDKFYSVI